jgi:excisionase family DNA binding protein
MDAQDAAVLSVEQAAKVVGIGRNTAYRMVHEGVLPALRLGRRLVVPKSALARLLDDPTAFTRGKHGYERPRRQGEEHG